MLFYNGHEIEGTDMTYEESLEQKGWTWTGDGWESPCGNHWFETDREAAGFAERRNANSYDSNYVDEWQ